MDKPSFPCDTQVTGALLTESGQTELYQCFHSHLLISVILSTLIIIIINSVYVQLRREKVDLYA